MLVMKKKQKFFLWCNCTKYPSILSDIIQCQSLFSSYLLPLLFLLYSIQHSRLFLLNAFHQKETWLDGIFPPQISVPSCVVRRNFVIFMKQSCAHVLRRVAFLLCWSELTSLFLVYSVSWQLLLLMTLAVCCRLLQCCLQCDPGV